jgi:hypothetical protein
MSYREEANKMLLMHTSNVQFKRWNQLTLHMRYPWGEIVVALSLLYSHDTQQQNPLLQSLNFNP